MKVSLVAAISIIGLLGSELYAQRGGAAPVGGARPGGGFNVGGWNRPGGGFNPVWNGPGNSIHPGAFRRNTFGRGNFFGSPFLSQGFPSAGVLPWTYPAFGGEFGYLGDFFNAYQQQPSYAVVAPTAQERPAPPPPPPPPAPAAPVISQYHWPESSSPPLPFSIVGSDGVEHLATSVWVQGDRVYFTAPEGGARQLVLSAVSRRLTEAANARKNLKLPLP